MVKQLTKRPKAELDNRDFAVQLADAKKIFRR